MSIDAPRYGVLNGRLDAPAARRMARVAELLGDQLRQQVVFIGASLLPLMETEDHVLSASRATDDVDAVIATATYSLKHDFESALRAKGFRHDVGVATHVDRWRTPDDVIFDCVSCGQHVGGTGNALDRWVYDQAVETDLPPRTRHASAVGLLLLKVAAYTDRGASSPMASKDLSDITTLFATRPELVGEVSVSESDARAPIAAWCQAVANSPRMISAIRSHIASRQPMFEGVDDLVLERMRRLV